MYDVNMSEISHCYYNAPTFIHINYNKSVKIRFCHRIVVAVPVSVSPVDTEFRSYFGAHTH